MQLDQQLIYFQSYYLTANKWTKFSSLDPNTPKNYRQRRQKHTRLASHVPWWGLKKCGVFVRVILYQICLHSKKKYSNTPTSFTPLHQILAPLHFFFGAPQEVLHQLHQNMKLLEITHHATD